MRILILSQIFPPDVGGGPTRAFNIAEGLRRLGHEVIVIAAFPHYPHGKIPSQYHRKPLKIERIRNLTLIRTWVPGLASNGVTNRLLLFASFMLSALLPLPMIRRPDVVWCANPNIVSFFPGKVYSLVFRCPLFLNVDDLWPEALIDLKMIKKGSMSSFLFFLSNLAYNACAGVTPISPSYVQDLKGHGVPLRKIQIIPAGVDSSRFVDIDYSIPKNSKFKLLYLGVLSPAYDFDQLFEAALKVSNLPDIEIVITGPGELGDYLIGLKSRLNSTNVVVDTRSVNRSLVPITLASADVLLLPLRSVPSVEKGISSKLYEYQAAGRPIICCSAGEPGKYVARTDCGLVVNPGDVEALADAIRYMYNNPEKCKSYGQKGRDYARKNVSIESLARSFIKFVSK